MGGFHPLVIGNCAAVDIVYEALWGRVIIPRVHTPAGWNRWVM